ncbi:MAG: argininosuccinate lyase [Planctomycetota bacterium]
MSLWGGRFAGGQHPAFDAFNRSLPFDRVLWREDLEGSRGWVRAQRAAKSLAADEAERLLAALDRLEADLAEDPAALRESQAEDIHGYVEAHLVEELGDLGKKLHAGRSRNDQVATDLRLWCRHRTAELDLVLGATMKALAVLAAQEAATPIPGYTHLQRAQVVTVGHHALAYVEMLARDRDRLAAAAARLDECPLGSGALAGTFLPVDREALARDLGFARPTRNSLDAVSDRDFVAELLFVATLSGAHLSRLAEDWIFFASQEAGFLELGDEVTTGSSLMPHKKNPDSLELIRGKGARLLGRMTGFLACLRSLPLAYDKDLQEDKEALFEVLETWEACLVVARLCVESARFDAERCAEACRRGYLDATELAELLVAAGVPFREAHDQVGRLVRLGLEQGRELTALSDDEVRRIAPAFEPSMRASLAIDAILARRTAKGAANPALVRAEAEAWTARL